MATEQEILLSRQASLFGDVNSLKFLRESKVLVVNVNEIALEIGKNLCLSGVDTVYFYNDKDYTMIDLYKNENYILLKENGRLESLVFLNNNEQYSYHHNFEMLNRINPSIVVLADAILTSDKIKTWNDICRSQNIPFLVIQSYGLISALFVDMGNSYTFSSTTPEFQIKKIITHIDSTTGVVTVADKNHQFSLSSYIKFSGLNGCEELMGEKSFKVVDLLPGDNDKFKIELPEKISEYKSGGSCEEVSIKITRQNKSLEQNLDSMQCESPKYFESGNLIDPLIYYFLIAISLFRESHHRLPLAHNERDYQVIYLQMISAYPQVQSLIEDAENSFFKKAIFQASGILPPMNSIIAGIASHECLKIIHATHEVINQWFWFERISLLDENYLNMPASQFEDIGSKYDGQIRIFGNGLQENLMNRKIFLVGSGALGCEFLKLFSMMGIGCGCIGQVYLADPDDISPSNLHRQLLFNKNDINNSKSITATNKLSLINENIKISSFNCEVTFSSLLNTFTYENYWETLDEIFGALDTVSARHLLSVISTAFTIPYLDSGTRGSGCNTRLYFPPITPRFHQIENVEESEANCLGKEYPFRPRHTITWAKELFLKIFLTSINLLESFEKSSLNDIEPKEEFVIHDIGEKLLGKTTSALISSFQVVRSGEYHNKEKWCKELFRWLFTEGPQSILKVHPIDSCSPFDQSQKFWVGIRIPPKELLFDENDVLCQEFIISTIDVLDCVFPPSQKPIPFGFDKDNQKQINFIHAVGNLYSRVYGIPLVSKLQTQMIAGEIIPAIITTTSICVGFTLLDYFKLLQTIPSRKEIAAHTENSNLINQYYEKLKDYRNYAFLSTQNKLITFPISKITEEEQKKDIFRLTIVLECTISSFIEQLNKKYEIDTLRIYYPESELTIFHRDDINGDSLLHTITMHTNYSTTIFLLGVEYLVANNVEKSNFLCLKVNGIEK